MVFIECILVTDCCLSPLIDICYFFMLRFVHLEMKVPNVIAELWLSSVCPADHILEVIDVMGGCNLKF